METWEKSGSLETYVDSLRIQSELDLRLSSEQEKSKWLKAFHYRADRLDKLYQQNKTIAAALQEALQKPLTPRTADLLYRQILKTSRRLRRNGHVPMPGLALLIPYYESHRDVDKLARIYGFSYDILASSSAKAQKHAAVPKTVYSRKIIALRNEYSSMNDEQARMELFSAYYMICVAERAEGLVSVDESYQFLREMLDLWESPAVQKRDGDNEHIRWYVDMTKQDWLSVEEDIDHAGPETRAYFCRLAESCWEEEQNANEFDFLCNSSLYAAYCHARVLQGELSWNDALQAYFARYKERLAHPEAEITWPDQEPNAEPSADEASFLLETPLAMARWLPNCTDPALQKEVIARLKTDTTSLLYQKFAATTDATTISELSRWCFTMLPYLSSREEKKEWLFNLVIRKQFLIHLHSVMVEKLASTIADGLLRDRPELFVDIPSQPDGESLSAFISSSALFHDIGKYEIAGIVNTQVRDLDTEELAEIYQHPVYGHVLFRDDPDLSRYGDVILGHHRFYNGSGGYPASFDNTQSPYRIVIDLIAVCDSLDAATDTLGRSYKRAKSFDQVLAELVQDQGVRYNPDIVTYIQESEDLQAQLRTLVTDERDSIAYAIHAASKS